MTDVSRKVTKDLLDFATRTNLSIPELLDPKFHTSSGYVSWSAFIQLCENISRAYGSDSWAVKYAESIHTKAPIHFRKLAEVARYVTEPKWMFWIAQKWIAPINFRNQTFEYKKLGRNKLRWTDNLDKNHKDSITKKSFS